MSDEDPHARRRLELTTAAFEAIMDPAVKYGLPPAQLCMITENVVISIAVALERMTGTTAEMTVEALRARLPAKLAEYRETMAAKLN